MLHAFLAMLSLPVMGLASRTTGFDTTLDLAALTKHVLTLEETVFSLQSQSQTQEQKYAAVLSSVLSKLAETTEELNSLKTNYTSLETELTSLKNLMEKNNVSESGLQSVVLEVAAMQLGHRSLESNLTSVKSEMTHLKHDLSMSETKLTSLVHEVSNVTEAICSVKTELKAGKTNVQQILPTGHGVWNDRLSAFDVMQSGEPANVTGSTHGRIIFNRIRYNLGFHYNKNDGMFTAPINGTYMFWVSVIGSLAISNQESAVDIRTNDTHGRFGTGVSFTTVGFLQAGEQVWFTSDIGSIFKPNSNYGGALLWPGYE